MFNLNRIVRGNIEALKPYSSARDEFEGKAEVYLDANENPFNSGLNRYPDPMAIKLKKKVSEIKKLNIDNIFLGNGSDEAIDLLFRIFCEPGKDNVIIPEPTYGMYSVCAEINDVKIIKASLNEKFDINADYILNEVNKSTKIIFLCSPNNPSGNIFSASEIKKILVSFEGIVVLDEAYIDFSSSESWLNELRNYENLVILQTLSKAWGLAGIRLGMAFASDEIIKFMNNVKYPYNLNILTQDKAYELLSNEEVKDKQVETILREREFILDELNRIDDLRKIFPTEANFILISVDNPVELYNFLVRSSIIVRDRSKVHLCEGCLRITVGTPEENKRLIVKIKKFFISG